MTDFKFSERHSASVIRFLHDGTFGAPRSFSTTSCSRAARPFVSKALDNIYTMLCEKCNQWKSPLIQTFEDEKESG
jgi:hypothetical protein